VARPSNGRTLRASTDFFTINGRCAENRHASFRAVINVVIVLVIERKNRLVIRGTQQLPS
jgi:hypothetical protein